MGLHLPRDYLPIYWNQSMLASDLKALFFMGHIDDSFLMGYNYASCEENIVQTVNMFLKLGFVIHPAKSVLVPCELNSQFSGNS